MLEQVQAPPVAGNDRVFDDQGFFVEVLTLDYEDGPVHLLGGKMHVNFGNAWDVTPGVFGTDLAEEYEMADNMASAALIALISAKGERTRWGRKRSFSIPPG